MSNDNLLSHKARGTMPDGETQGELLLIKFVSFLRLTDQIRMLTYRAVKEKKKLMLIVPNFCSMSEQLVKHISDNRKIVKVVRK
jgi:hypothetical protein